MESDDVMADLFGDDADMVVVDLEELLADEAEGEAAAAAEVADEAEGGAVVIGSAEADEASDVEQRHPISIADLPAAAEPAGDTEPDLATAEAAPEAEAEATPVDETAIVPDIEPTAEPDLMNSQVQGTLPDWLIDDDDAAPDSIGWMEAIGDSSVTDWLTAEEESLSSTFEVVDTDSLAVPGTGPLDERKLPSGDTGSLDASPVVRTVDEPSLKPEEAAPPVAAIPPADMDMDSLEAARAAVRSAAFDEAVAGYTDLLQKGVGLDVLIGDLQDLHEAQPNALLVRLLGDVYMRDGQLQNALDSYRQALDLM